MDSNIMITNPGPLAIRKHKPKDTKSIDRKSNAQLNKGMREYNKTMWFRSSEGMKAIFDQEAKSRFTLQKIESMKYDLADLKRDNFGAPRHSSLDNIDDS